MANLDLQRYYLSNQNGMQVTLSNFGARILSILVPDEQSKLTECTLNHQTDDAIINDVFYMGATCGRVCNRIANGRFSLDGKEYSLDTNQNGHCLHGGSVGFDKRYWQSCGVQNEQRISFLLDSANGDQGFPGSVKSIVSYHLSDSNELNIEFYAETTQPSPINLCNHAYFTLGASQVSELILQINADAYIPTDASGIPLGNFVPIDNTVFDFNTAKNIDPMQVDGGFDHCFRTPDDTIAHLFNPQNGIMLSLISDQAGCQLYTGNHLTPKYSALCLEAQGFPDAINQPQFPVDILRSDLAYQRQVTYRFTHGKRIE